MVFPHGSNHDPVQFTSNAPRTGRYTQAGYQQIQKVNRQDRFYFLWRGLSQMFILLLIGICAWIAWGSFHGRAVWQWVTGYWALLALKHICDFMARRIK